MEPENAAAEQSDEGERHADQDAQGGGAILAVLVGQALDADTGIGGAADARFFVDFVKCLLETLLLFWSSGFVDLLLDLFLLLKALLVPLGGTHLLVAFSGERRCSEDGHGHGCCESSGRDALHSVLLV